MLVSPDSTLPWEAAYVFRCEATEIVAGGHGIVRAAFADVRATLETALSTWPRLPPSQFRVPGLILRIIRDDKAE